MEALLNYLLRILPGLVWGILFLILLPKRNLEFRILSYILLFVLVRDAMTPLQFWSFGAEDAFWLRFTDDPVILIAFGVVSLAAVFLINRFEKDMKALLVWWQGQPWAGITVGLMGALLVATPFLIISSTVPVELRGGEVARNMILPILCVALLGNFLEEVLFRGYFQGYMQKHTGPWQAAILSGIMFGFGHIFLAITVTNVGYPLLAFATFEGIIAGLVRMRYGLIPATLTHGGAIFLLASNIL